MLRYPVRPDKFFVKRVIGVEGDKVRIEDGRVLVNDVPRADDEVAADARSYDHWGPQMVPDGPGPPYHLTSAPRSGPVGLVLPSPAAVERRP